MALGVWMGALVMTAIAAAIVFPAMRELAPMLSGYPGATEDHWLIVAGHLAAPLFAILGWTQLACLATAGAALILIMLAAPGVRTGALGRIRLIVLALLAALAGYYAGSLEPRMAHELEAYWSAARAGLVDDANLHRERFNEDHPMASRVLGATAVIVGLGLALAIATPASAGASAKEMA